MLQLFFWQEEAHTISIKKYLDQDADRKMASMEAAYRSALLAMGRCAGAALNTTSYELQQGLKAAEVRFQQASAPELIKETEIDVSRLLERWGLRTANHLKQTAAEVKSLLVAVAGTADAVGERDQQCTIKLKQLTSRLEKIAQLDDMSRMRDSILQSASELKSCVRDIIESGAQTTSAFRTQLKSYEDKLARSEQLILRDSLTDVFNRHGMERIIECHIEDRSPFNLAMVDLDNFKQVNDRYGHLAGDDLLKQFADELKSASRSTDILGRWGGDEFVLILEGTAEDAATIVERLKRLVNGRYSVASGLQRVKIEVEASFGIAAWKPGETAEAIMARADTAMYVDKVRQRPDKAVVVPITPNLSR